MPTIWLEDSLYKQVSDINCWFCAKCYIYIVSFFTIALGSLELSPVTRNWGPNRQSNLSKTAQFIRKPELNPSSFQCKPYFFFFSYHTYGSLELPRQAPNKGTFTIRLRKICLGRPWTQTSFTKKWSLVDPDFPLSPSPTLWIIAVAS